ncbi:MAG: leucine-rich repeat protein [Alphaproteobacteria bacterium]|nr:leucine-rich repeat protein [Alphaproteobacteria bacterium]
MKCFNFVFMLMMLCANQSYAACNAETGKDDDGDYCGSWDCGATGSNVTCTLSKGTLTISGEGEMKDYTANTNGSESAYPRLWIPRTPWSGKYVTKAVIEGNVTRIGDLTFAGEKYLTEISGTENLQSIGASAFNRTSLSSVDIPNVTHLGAGAFHMASSLQYVNMRDDVVLLNNDWFSYLYGTFKDVNVVKNSCVTNPETGMKTCGSCGEKFVQAGVGCVDKCYKDYMPCSGYCCLRTRYTLQEADEATSNDNENMIEWIFE